MTTATLNGAKKQFDAYRPSHETSRKPGLLLWNGRIGDILFWSDGVRVHYDPAGDDEEGPVEKVTLQFHSHLVTVYGHELMRFFIDCQKHLPDFLRVSSDEEILRGSGTIITRIKIEEPQKEKGRKTG